MKDISWNQDTHEIVVDGIEIQCADEPSAATAFNLLSDARDETAMLGKWAAEIVIQLNRVDLPRWRNRDGGR